MGQANHDGCACSAIRGDTTNATARSTADWLRLAATPVFALMALLGYVPGNGAADLICSAAHGGSALSGMVPMYLLMATFHSAPWLKLVASRRHGLRPRENIVSIDHHLDEEDFDHAQSRGFARGLAEGAARTAR